MTALLRYLNPVRTAFTSPGSQPFRPAKSSGHGGFPLTRACVAKINVQRNIS